MSACSRCAAGNRSETARAPAGAIGAWPGPPVSSVPVRAILGRQGPGLDWSAVLASDLGAIRRQSTIFCRGRLGGFGLADEHDQKGDPPRGPQDEERTQQNVADQA